jgi:uncharacterized protein YegJ (DUF2314 family)
MGDAPFFSYSRRRLTGAKLTKSSPWTPSEGVIALNSQSLRRTLTRFITTMLVASVGVVQAAGVPTAAAATTSPTSQSLPAQAGAQAAAGAYQEFALHTSTPLLEVDDTFTFAVAGNRDLLAIKTRRTASGRVEIHVLSAASKYQAFSLHTRTALAETDDTFDFAVAPNRDVFAIKKSLTGSNTTEVHVLSAASNYQAFSLHTRTALAETDDTFDFAVAPNRDVFGVFRKSTASNTTELHVLKA